MNNVPDIKNKTIVFFDGSCGLCNRAVKFVLRKERNHELFFSPLQSAFANKTLGPFNLGGKADTIVVLKNEKLYIKSSAALHITKYLKGLWPATMAFLIVPRFLRDAVYDYIAKNRIPWFGAANYCDMMTPELKERFLE